MELSRRLVLSCRAVGGPARGGAYRSPRSACAVRIGCEPPPGKVACWGRDIRDAAVQHSAVPVLFTSCAKTRHIPTARTHMASASSRLVTATVRRLPAPVRRKLEGETGKRFLRFVLVAAAAVISSQIAL